MNIALAFAQYGPYHHARARALADALSREDRLYPVQIAAATRTYAWKTSDAPPLDLTTLLPGAEEDARFSNVFAAALSFFRSREITAALLPSYAPASSFALFCAAKLAGVRCIMMNESHAGTERAQGWKRWLKRQLVRRFDAALVGGSAQTRHFASLGIPKERIFTGYDAVDNEYFAKRSEETRRNPQPARTRLALPERYFLSLGRMVPKKNLGTLIRAYAKAAQSGGSNFPHLVFVGSGEEEPALRELTTELGLPTVNHARDDSPTGLGSITTDTQDDANACPGLLPAVPSGLINPVAVPNTTSPRPSPAVHFYGFRQVDENPIFYALADCFVLPSLYEEWGLVVNEGMACGLPILVSITAGCAEDLAENGGNGYRFDPTDADSLAKRLQEVSADPSLRDRMGARSREIIGNWGCDNFALQALRAITSANGEVRMKTDE